MNRSGLFVVVFALASTGACGKSSSHPSNNEVRFELVCDSTDTRDVATLFCVRHDTRDGDVRQVAVNALPRSKANTAATVGQPGDYALHCHSTRTADSSDLFCVRINTQTGDMLLIALPKIGIIPEGAELVPMVTEARHEHGADTHTHAAPEPETKMEAPATKSTVSHEHGGRSHTHEGGATPHEH